MTPIEPNSVRGGRNASAFVPPLPASSFGGAAALARCAEGMGEAVETMSVHEVRRQMHLVRSARAVLDAREVALHRRMTELSVTPGSGCALDPTREIVHHAGLRRRDTQVIEVRASTVETVPMLGELLSAGATTAAHVDAVGQALKAAGDGREALLAHVPQIAERAVTMDADSFGRFVQRLSRDVQTDDGMSRFRHQQRTTELRMWNDRDGMVRVSGAFDPERGAMLAGCLDRQVEAMFHSGDREVPLDVAPGIDPNNHRRALALHRLCTRPAGSADGDPFDTRPARAEVVVHVDLATLQSGLHERSVCRTSQGTDIPHDVARRLACDADIIPVVLSGGSVPLDVGRAKRLATIHQRRALEATYPTCPIDECDVPFTRCVIHHLHPWEHGGDTALDNLVPLCTRHHHDVHDNGWQLDLDPETRRLTVTLPGRPVADAEVTDVELAENEPKGAGSRVNASAAVRGGVPPDGQALSRWVRTASKISPN